MVQPGLECWGHVPVPQAYSLGVQQRCPEAENGQYCTHYNCNLCQRLQLLSGCNIDRANRRVAAASTEYLWLASDISMGQNMLPRTAPFRGGILAAWPHIVHGFLGPPVCRAHAYVQPTDVQTLRLTDHHGTSVIIARILALCASSVPNAV